MSESIKERLRNLEIAFKGKKSLPSIIVCNSIEEASLKRKELKRVYGDGDILIIIDRQELIHRTKEGSKL